MPSNLAGPPAVWLPRANGRGMASDPETRFEQLLAELARADVAFCVVGSFALAVHGAPRASADIDLVPETSMENLSRLAEALDGLGVTLEPGGESVRLTGRDLGAQADLKLYTKLGVLHLLEEVEGVPPFSALARNALSVDVNGQPVMFCSREDLVEMKKASGRLIDRADLERLMEFEDE